MKYIKLLAIFLLVSAWGCSQNVTSDEEGFVSLFDGHSLLGWEGDSTYWRVEDGIIVGEVTPETLLDRNSFLIWREGVVEDFELKVVFRVSDEGNSGINYRSEEVEGLSHALRGYQADIDGAMQYSGMNYEERRRTTIAWPGQTVVINTPPAPELSEFISSNHWTLSELKHEVADLDSLKANMHRGEWNEMHIIARGNVMSHYINGVLFSEVEDNDEIHRRARGLIGVQVHVGPPMKIEYKRILLKHIGG